MSLELANRWPNLFLAVISLGVDSTRTLTRKDSFRLEQKVRWSWEAQATAIEQIDDFLAGGDSEERCEWLLTELDDTFDPVPEFGTDRGALLWMRRQLSLAVDAGPQRFRQVVDSSRADD